MPKAPPLQLPSKPINHAPEMAAFIATAKHEPPAAPAIATASPGHVQTASGEVKRRMVLTLSSELGSALDQMAESTGAARTWHVERLLRQALGMEVGR